MRNKILIEDVKRIQLNILKYVDDTLSALGISYWLDCGTLLGSVRHKGYIPWDDDIDLIILRKDYDRAISALNSNSERYKVLTMNNTKDFFYLFAKITDTHTHIKEKGLREIGALGIYIDLFPLDYLPLKEKEYKRHVDGIFRLRSLIYYSLLDKSQFMSASFENKCKSILGKLIGRKRLMTRVDKMCRDYSAKGEGYIADIVGAGSKNRKIPSMVFDDTIMSEFEGRLYPIPVGYKQYLTFLYGDYMQLPPEEKRVSTHDFQAFWID